MPDVVVLALIPGGFNHESKILTTLSLSTLVANQDLITSNDLLA